MWFVLWWCIASAADSDHETRWKQSQALAQEFSTKFSGVWRVVVDGEPVFEQAMGWSNEENRIPMKLGNVFPLGSNTKLLTAVGLYQMQEQGRIDLNASVQTYLDASDFANFGFSNLTTWCPRVSPDDPCETITMHQLLSMSSGLMSAFTCEGSGMTPDSPYCHPLGGPEFLLYGGSIAEYVGLFINNPLAFKPGTSYGYANPNFVLAAYVLEKLAGQPLSTYFDEAIFQPTDMTTAAYKPYDGQYGITAHYADQYVKYFYQTEDEATYLSTGTCRPYWSSGSLSGTGGVTGANADLVKLYRDLFENQGATSKILSQASISSLVQRWTAIPDAPAGVYFGQGLTVRYLDPESTWPDQLFFCGETACSKTCIAMQGHVIATAFSNNAHLTFDSVNKWESWKTQHNPAYLVLHDQVLEEDGHASEVRMRLLHLWI